MESSGGRSGNLKNKMENTRGSRGSRGGMEAASDPTALCPRWADLHQHLLNLILARLPLQDQLRFRAVCRGWQEAVPQCPQLPWLLLPQEKPGGRRVFYDLSERREYRLHVPVWAAGTRCIGASGGWLLLLDCDTTEVFLVNPITKDQFKLPPLADFHGGRRIGCAAISPSAEDPSSITVVILLVRYVICCRVGDRQWSLVLDIGPTPVPGNALAFLEGTLFMFSNIGDRLLAVDFTALPGPVFAWLDLDASEMDDGRLFCHSCFLVECDEDLLLVRCDNGRIGDNRLPLFVYRADLDRKKWVRMEDLDGRLLFLSRGCCSSVPPAATGRLRNRICFNRPTNAPNPYVPWAEYEMKMGSGVAELVPDGSDPVFERSHYRGLNGPEEPQWVIPRM